MAQPKSKRVGNYELVGKLGAGSYAQVFKAVNVTNGKVFAVKAIAKDKIGDPKLQENLDSEIAIMRDYQHPNIVRLFERMSSPKTIYLILELCPGGDLSKFIRTRRRLDEKVAQCFLRQLSDGLFFLNQKNVIHRDLKPANVLLSEDSDFAVLKLADFGFAKHLTEASMAQTPCGTPLYMAPEVFEMQDYDAKADLWSVGCIFYEMLVGTPPFKGSSPRDLYHNIKSKQLSVPTDVVLSHESLVILQRLLERNPIRRVSLIKFYEGCRFLKLLTPADSTSSSSSHVVGSDGVSGSTATTPGVAVTTTASENAMAASNPAVVGAAMSITAGVPSNIVDPNVVGVVAAAGPQAPATVPSLAAVAGASNLFPTPPAGNPTVTGTSLSNPSAAAAAERALHPATATTIVAISQPPFAVGQPPSGAETPRPPMPGPGGASSSKSPKKPLELNDTTAVNSDEPRGGESPSPRLNSRLANMPSSIEKEKQQLYHQQHQQQYQPIFGRNNSSSPAPSNKQSSSPSPVPPASMHGSGGEDDFVIVESTAAHPYRQPGSVYDKDSYVSTPGTAKTASVFGVAMMSNNNAQPKSQTPTAGLQQPPQHSSSPKVASNVRHASSSLSLQQQHNMKHLAAMVRDIQREVNHSFEIVTAIVFVGDKLVIEAIAHEQLLSSKQQQAPQQQTPTMLKERPPSSSTSNSGRNRGESFNMDATAIGNNFSVACAMYLHSLTITQDACNKVLKAIDEQGKDSCNEHTLTLCKLRVGLLYLFDQLLTRTEQCEAKLQAYGIDHCISFAEACLYPIAVQQAKEANIQEMLGNLVKSCELYSNALWLIEGIQLTAHQPEDKIVLRSFADALREQLDVCKQKCSILYPATITKPTKVQVIERLAESAANIGTTLVKQQYEKQLMQQNESLLMQQQHNQQHAVQQQAGNATSTSAGVGGGGIIPNVPMTQSMMLLSQQQQQQLSMNNPGAHFLPAHVPLPGVTRRNSARY